MPAIRIGISGWTYDDWRGSFYPEGLRQKDELAFASRHLSSIEVNGTFYSLLKPENYRSWSEQTPAHYCLALKGPKFITHERRLRDCATPLANFFASGVLALGEKLGPILWQLPPSLPFDVERLTNFLSALPTTHPAAAAMGVGHSEWLKGRTVLEARTDAPLRHAIEVRHDSFRDATFIDLARQFRVAIVVGDTAGRWPYIEDATTDFAYVRLHGDELEYPEGYTKAALERWGERLRGWQIGEEPEDAVLVTPTPEDLGPRDVFAYFDNDSKAMAPLNALSLISHMEQEGFIPSRPNFPDLPRPLARRTPTQAPDRPRPSRREAPTRQPKAVVAKRATPRKSN